MNVCVIPARGGSKRIPRKNIKLFHGRPMIWYPIATAKASGLFDEVTVSTDDEEIATQAHLAGISHVIKRPPELADDNATTMQVMNHAVRYLDHGSLQHVCCLYPCTPLVEVADLDAGLLRLQASGKCYVLPLAQMAPPMQRALRMDEHGAIQAVWPQFNDVRSQDLEPRFYDPGQWYWGKADAWMNEVPIYGTWSLGMRIPRGRAIDIDTEDDWRLAEALYARGQR